MENLGMKQIYILMILAMLVATFAFFPTQRVQAQATILKIVPARATTTSVILNISIQNVADMMTWQVNVSWDPTQLEFANVIFPDPTNDFVFANEPFYTMGPITGPNSAIFSVVCDTAGDGQTFTGSGTLAQLNLTKLTPDPLCEIKFENIPMDTFILDSTGTDIPFTTQSYTIPEMSSLLLIVLAAASSSMAVILKKKAKVKK
ncbi:MAG: hypothetical protein QXQ61_04355 [Candidatus Bathyarchaeia archaeon]